jgi:transposase
MAQTVCVLVSMADRQRLEAIAADRNRQRKHIERVEVILASGGGGPVQQIVPQIGISRPMVWRWQQRFADEGVDGLLRDKMRKPGKPPIAAETVARVVPLASRGARCSASGKRTICNRIGSALQAVA